MINGWKDIRKESPNAILGWVLILTTPAYRERYEDAIYAIVNSVWAAYKPNWKYFTHWQYPPKPPVEEITEGRP